MAKYGESPGESSMREARAMTIMENEYKRRIWEAEFWKMMQEHYKPWESRLLHALRLISHKYETGDWPMTDLPDGSDC